MGRFSPVAQTPRYMAAFQCVGSACPQSCCSGWGVSIDKPTFQRYRSVKIEPLATLLHTHVQRCDNPDTGFAKVQMGSDAACPFLDEERLCQIQRQLGAEALSRTCSDYPRQYSHDGEEVGLCATLSCPEAARLALTDPQALDPIALTLDFANEQLVPFHLRRAAAAADADAVRRLARLLAQVVQAVVRFEGLTAVQAMISIGLLLRRIARLNQANELTDQAVAEAVDHYLSPEQLAQTPSRVAALPVSRAKQLELLLGASKRYVSTQPTGAAFKELMNEVWQGLRGAEGLELSAQTLTGIADTELPAFEAAHPHALKNYLLNELIYAMFPRQGAAELEREFMAIAVRFALVRLYFCGLMARGRAEGQEAVGIDALVRVVYLVTRAYTHNQRFMPALLDSLAEHDALRLDVLATLIL